MNKILKILSRSMIIVGAVIALFAAGSSDAGADIVSVLLMLALAAMTILAGGCLLAVAQYKQEEARSKRIRVLREQVAYQKAWKAYFAGKI